MSHEVHLPKKQSVCFKYAESLEHIVRNESRSKNVLKEFFAYNAAHPSKPRFCFPDFIEHHVWHALSNNRNKRKHSTVIGRLTLVAP